MRQAPVFVLAGIVMLASTPTLASTPPSTPAPTDAAPAPRADKPPISELDPYTLFTPDLEALRLDTQAHISGLIENGDAPTGPMAGFIGGIDPGTAAFYSSGALLGLAGSYFSKDDEEEVGGGGGGPGDTSYTQNPGSFVTDEFENQYGLGAIRAQYAYARGHTGEGVLVSVMDTRFNTAHADLEGVFVQGYNVVDNNSVVNADCLAAHNPCRHGTHIAGIIAGNRDGTDTTMHGVAYGARIKPVPFLEIGITTGLQQIQAFDHASGADNASGLQIVAMNNSWGAAPNFHSSTHNGKYFKIPNEGQISNLNALYIGSAIAAEDDTILVFAAGNEGWNAETGRVKLYDSASSDVVTGYASATAIVADQGTGITSANRIDTHTAMPTYAPDTSPYVIDADENEYMWLVVVATDENNVIADFSNACGVARNYCLAAPGEQIFAPNGVPDGDGESAYVTLNGTSMATPHVTGAIAILADMYPNLLDTPENITQILLETATDLGAEGVDDIYGHGLLNLEAATGPLGDISITDSGFPASRSSYNGAAIFTPVAFGDSLSQGGVHIGGVDKFERVFLLNLPTAVAEDMRPPGMAERAMAVLESPAESPQIMLGRGLGFAPQYMGKGGAIRGTRISYAEAGEAHQIGASFTMDMETEAPAITATGSQGYAHYFDTMAHATRERMAFEAAQTTPDGSRMMSSVRLDHDDKGRMTFIAQSGYEAYIGGTHLNLSLGGMSEEGRLLGGEMTGALTVSSTHTLLAQSRITAPLPHAGRLTGFYEYAYSRPDFIHSGLVEADGITSDSYGISWQHEPRPGAQLALVLHRPVAATGGRLAFNTITGYDEGGGYRAQTLGYNLAPAHRETALLAEYRRHIVKGVIIAFGINHRINADNIEGREDTGGFLRGEMRF